MSTPTITEQYEQLTAAVADARQRESQRSSERRRTAAALAAAEGEVEQYMRDLAGHDPDPARLDELRAQASAIRVRMRPVEVTAPGPSGHRGDVRVIGVDWVDPAAEAMWEGAVDAHTRAREALDQFRRDHVDDLLAERVPAVAAARDRFAAAIAELAAADAQLAAEGGWIVNLGAATGAWDQDAVPRLPLGDDVRAAIGQAAAAVATNPDRALMVPRVAAQRP